MEDKKQINTEELAKADLRVGLVTEAEEVNNSEKLLKLIIQSDDETRQIIAGIRKYYSPSEIVGRQVLFVSNLAPRNLAGLESQGMILVAHDKNGFSLLSPDRTVENGSAVN